MERGATEAETCALNGWKVGTILRGEECGRWMTIRITAIGDKSILARHLEANRWGYESTWTLTARAWFEVDGNERA